MVFPVRGTQAVKRHVHTFKSPFGRDFGGRVAERFARFFGTFTFITIQTVLVIMWIVYNKWIGNPFDPFPFILLNLMFSTQAAYAAPLILLAQTRQAERDDLAEQHRQAISDMQMKHAEEMATQHTEMLNAIHAAVKGKESYS